MDIQLGNKIRLFFLLLMFGAATAFGQQQWPLYDINNHPWRADTVKGTYCLVLKNNKTCLNCYKELDTFFHNSVPGMRVYYITISDSSVLARKLGYREAINLMPDLKQVLYDYETASGEMLVHSDLHHSSPFYEYNVDITPALIKVENGQATYYSYRQLYDKNGNVDHKLEDMLTGK